MKKSVAIIVAVIVASSALVTNNGNIAYGAEPNVIWLDKNYDHAWRISDGFVSFDLNGKYSYIDKTGKELTPLKYDTVGEFSEGLAIVGLNGKYGYIDKTGKEVIPLIYDRAQNFSEEYASVELNGKCGYIDGQGKEVIPFIYDSSDNFSECLAAVQLDNYYGYIDKTGKEILPFIYGPAEPFKNGLALVNMYYGGGYTDCYIDKEGDFVKYDLSRSIVPVTKGNGPLIGYIDEYDNNRELTPFKYDVAGYFYYDDYVRVGKNGKYGYIDKTGKEIVPLKYDEVDYYFYDGLARVKLNDKYGFVDKTGKEVIPLKYDYVDSFGGGIAPVADEKWGFIDVTGKEVIPLKYDYAYTDSYGGLGGLGVVKLNDKWGIIENPLALNTILESQANIISLESISDSLTLEEGQTTNLFTNVQPSDATLTYSTSDSWIATVSDDGNITARRLGTAVISIKASMAGYDEVIKNINVTVTGLKTFELTLEPKLVILRQGDIRRITTNASKDVTLTSAVSNPSIVGVEIQGIGGILKANSPGESSITFTAEKSGYSTNYVDGKAIVLDDNYNSSDVIKQSTDHWYDIDSEDKSTRSVREKIAQDSENIITSLTKKNITGSNGLVVLDRSTIEEMVAEAKDIKLEVSKYAENLGISTSRGVNINLKAETDASPVNDIISIQLNKKDIVNHEDVDYLYTTIKKYGVTIGLDAKKIDELYSDNETILIQIKKDNDFYIIKFVDENGNEIDSLKHNIIIVLPINSTNSYEASVFKQADATITQLGGSYDSENEGISVQTKAGGRYNVSENKADFNDIDDKDEEMKKAIEFLSSKGIITGLSDEEFNPDGILSRSQFTTMLVKSFYALDPTLDASFKDVKPSDWFYDYVASSQKENIVKGYEDQTFKPNDNITKEQMIALVSRALVNKKQYIYPENSEDYLTFIGDKDKIDEWAKKEVALAVKERTIEIPTDFMLNPQGIVTRGEAARMLYRMFLKLY